MKPTVAAAVFLGKLHPPLPRTPRESEQLLRALTSSFRRELDRAHPTTAPASDKPAVASDANIERTTEDTPDSSTHAADQHLSTILENPLFRVAPVKPVISARTPHEDAILSRWSKDPMLVLDELIASGSATPATVWDCLSRQLVLISTGPGKSSSVPDTQPFIKALRDSRAGSRIVAWWLSSSSGQRQAILSHPRTLDQLAKFMVAEGLHAKVFAWLKTVADCNLGHPDGLITKAHAAGCFQRLLSSLLRAEATYGGGIVSCLRYYVRAYRLLIPTDGEETKLPLDEALGSPAGFLCILISRTRPKNRVHREDIPVELYMEFQDITSRMKKSELQMMTLRLFHPTCPDPTSYLQYARDLPPGQIYSWSLKKRQYITRLSFAALHILEDTKQADDYFFLKDFSELCTRHGDRKKVVKTDRRASSDEAEILATMDLAF
ncbi:hypothetical protein BJX70DRAFT_176515 [Aspergillus crustosus]